MQVPVEDILKIVEAFIAGSLLGLEREYRSKPAGLRTLIMITVGSTLFSILSMNISDVSPDRIASNIVTGVGFVGAGVIFKEGVNVRGITTAATIWAAAAIGMAIGFGSYWLAAATLAVILLTLLLLHNLEEKLDATHFIKMYTIVFDVNSYSLIELEKEFTRIGLKFNGEKLSRSERDLTVVYKVAAVEEKYAVLTSFLVGNHAIKSFEV